MNEGKSRTGVGGINKAVALLTVGAVVTGIVKFDGDKGFERVTLAEEKVGMFVGDLPEAAAVAADENVGKADLALDHGHWTDGGAETGVEVRFCGGEQAVGSAVCVLSGREADFAPKWGAF